MKTRSFLFFAAVFLIILVIVCFRINTITSQKITSYPTEINRLSIALGKDWDNTKQHKKDLIPTDQPFEYAVIDNDGNLLIYTEKHISTSVSSATTNYDVIRDIANENGEVVGKLLVHNDYRDQQTSRNRRISIICGAVLFAMLAATLGYFFYLKKRIVDPFDKMQHFASEVAAGNLDVPMQMDKNHVFGAFTESFDIMREELKASRLREAEAVKARKELVAQLSHDIKTPVTSIKAMTEFMELTAKTEEEKTTLQSINSKADQIDSLVTDLFHATLEELEHLEVNEEEATSQEIAGFITEADYLKKVKEVKIADAVVRADRLRLNQVIGNIFANSYKYADTEMTVESRIEKSVDGKNFLVIEIGDQGGGVPENEIETIFGKFRRGTNSDGKDGAGLGLYISRYLMEKMGGEITAANKNGGLCVVLRLLLI